jgi:hypothetical protein
MSRFETLSDTPNDIKIQALRDTLAELVTDWHTDGSSPPNFYRTTGLGRDVCKVDTHLDGYQWPFGEDCVAIGWKVDHHLDNNHSGGLVLVKDFLPTLKGNKKPSKKQFEKAVQAAIVEAKDQAEASLAEMDAHWAQKQAKRTG